MELTTPRKTAKASDSAFTGDVYVNPIKQKAEPSRLIASIVRFTPGARTAWHSHTVSQTLLVTDGVGLHQPRGGQVEQIRAGDVVVTPADVWHWHGAAADHYMTHLSITESPADGRPDAQWGDHVTDEECTAP